MSDIDNALTTLEADEAAENLALEKVTADLTIALANLAAANPSLAPEIARIQSLNEQVVAHVAALNAADAAANEPQPTPVTPVPPPPPTSR